jgi:uncharacterized NAD(P)/FAD-binding protein YdhS
MEKTKVAILGGGPSGLFLFKSLLEKNPADIEIEIFERKMQLGVGMPYSHAGANNEHITNVSDNEIPGLVNSIEEWAKSASKDTLAKFDIDPENFNEYKVLPRLFFGQYLSAQFKLLIDKAKAEGIPVKVHLGVEVTDILDKPDLNETWIELKDMGILKFNKVVICTGHNWPVKHEGKVPGYFDAPYPPSKLNLQLNHTVAIRGSSLTAIDAIRTIARNNGTFSKEKDAKLSYKPSAEGFKITMHSRNGLLPAVRFHLDDSHLSNDSLLTEQEIKDHIKENDGFLSLDYIFEKDFKDIFREKDPAFYEQIKHMNIEEFVAAMMELRERLDPFQLLSAEYAEAAQSIKRKESIYWKEMLGVLSFAMNYPAKYLSAEDMQRLQHTLIPLISIVIAYVPQSSCEELLALSNAGILSMIAVGDDSEIEPDEVKGGATYHYTDETGQRISVHYKTFIDCVGQPHLSYAEFPFKSMLKDGIISPARIKFRSAEEGRNSAAQKNSKAKIEPDGAYYLSVPGIAINDCFQVINSYGAYNERIYIMAVPYIGGFNPDYSGLDFCQEASGRITGNMFS